MLRRILRGLQRRRRYRPAPQGGPDPSTRYGRLYDVFMLMAYGTRLRDEEDNMRSLLAGARFRLTRAIATRSALRLFEGEPI